MKYILFMAAAISAVCCQAQYYNLQTPSLQAGIGYAKDFPGVQGPCVQIGYHLPVSNWFEVAAGLKHALMSGHPRSESIREYTRATAVDAEIFVLPVHTDMHILRVGLGYSFAFYRMKRSYPVMDKASGNVASWNEFSEKGRSRGMTLIASYQYQLRENLGAGIRVSLFKAYDQAFYAGPFIALSL